MDRLENVVQPYAWGSRESIARLQGRAAAEKPEAELWMGAHPLAPSKTPRGRLDALISADPLHELGQPVIETYGLKLPFLLKLLAAEQPLSLQAHPSLAQAKAGFAKEEEAKVPLTDPLRSYKDPNHKPELMCALTPFYALCGFREVKATLELLHAVGKTSLDPLFAPLREGQLELCFKGLMTARETWDAERQRAAVNELAHAVARAGAAFPLEARWTRRIAELYPGDLAVAAALLLNHLELKPYQAIYLPAGNLHAYLGGFGVEVMAASDNVLRGGLTPKHVDVGELLTVLEFKAGPVEVLEPTGMGEQFYETPAPEFRLSRLEINGPFTPERMGPELLLCTQGEVSAAGIVLKPGESVFCPAADPSYVLDGMGELFRCTVNDVQ